MTDSLLLHGKELISSKRAAETSGYAQDYIGQLARKGLIDAERVGGLWYVSMESLLSYKSNADSVVQAQPQAPTAGKESDTFISFDGKDYVSASRAAKLTGYNQDYIGQLARSGKILSRQVGNRWYVDREGLISHKSQKDSMLAAVQVEAVGLVRPDSVPVPTASEKPVIDYKQQIMNYFNEDKKDLLPAMSTGVDSYQPEYQEEYRQVAETTVPIRIVNRPTPAFETTTARTQSVVTPVRASAARTHPIHMLSRAVFAMTVVIVLSYGLVSLKNSALYSFRDMKVGDISSVANQVALSAGATGAFDAIATMIEDLVAPLLRYQRAR